MRYFWTAPRIYDISRLRVKIGRDSFVSDPFVFGIRNYLSILFDYAKV